MISIGDRAELQSIFDNTISWCLKHGIKILFKQDFQAIHDEYSLLLLSIMSSYYYNVFISLLSSC